MPSVFEDWLHEVSLLDLDEEITADLKHIADFASEHIAKRQCMDNSSLPLQYNTYSQQQNHPPATLNPPVMGSNSITANQSAFNNFHAFPCNTNNQRSGKHMHFPKLLPSEYDLLEKHSGCRKCCRFYVNNQVPDCPNDFPNPNTYSTLTEDMALQAMASAAIVSTYSSNPTTTSPFSQPFAPPTSFVKEIPIKTSNNQLIHTSVASVLPSSTTPFVLGTSASDTESDPSSLPS